MLRRKKKRDEETRKQSKQVRSKKPKLNQQKETLGILSVVQANSEEIVGLAKKKIKKQKKSVID